MASKAAVQIGPAAPELRRRCAWLHHGYDPHGSTEYKAVARFPRPAGELPLGSCRTWIDTLPDQL